ncbi:MAG: LruC domain-containing protein [Bacteroidia bacterium]
MRLNKLFRLRLLLLLSTALLFACKGKDDNPVPAPFAQLRVPQSFDWLSIRNLIINVTVNEGHNGLVMDLLDDRGNRIERSVIVDNRARFNVRMSTAELDVVIKSPVSGQQIKIPAVNTTEFFALNADTREIWEATPDTDGDSIPDLWDDFPNDPTLAFEQRVPYLGEHFYLFDEGWPALGDHDFNDLVFSTVTTYKYSPQRRLVSGSVALKLLAVSLNEDMGLGLELFSSIAGSTYAYTFGTAASFNGVTPDDSINNGAIIFNNYKDVQTVPYNNNGVGPSAVPELIQFSFDWNANIGGDYAWPNFYLFRTSNRQREIHVFGYPPTLMADFAEFSTLDDASIRRWNWGGSFAMPNAFYRSYRNLPWSIEFFQRDFVPVREGFNITQAYPLLINWAENAGATNLNWRNFPDNRYVFRVPQ